MRIPASRKLLIIAAAMVIVTSVGWYAKSTVASGERQDDAHTFEYGYRVEQFRFRQGTGITFWNSQGMTWNYEGHVSVRKVLAEKWLADGRAVYLSLILEYRDSVTEEVPVEVIYDYQKGTLYAYSTWGLWRLRNKGMPENKYWMTEGEFREALAHLERGEA
jgi:hypothetical protein